MDLACSHLLVPPAHQSRGANERRRDRPSCDDKRRLHYRLVMYGSATIQQLLVFAGSLASGDRLVRDENCTCASNFYAVLDCTSRPDTSASSVRSGNVEGVPGATHSRRRLQLYFIS